jgi:Synaptobrevin
MSAATPFTTSSSSFTSLSSSPQPSMTVPSHHAILWSCVARDDIILAEAGSDPYHGIVTQTAQELLCRAATPGYEFHSIRQPIKLSLPKMFRSSEQHQHQQSTSSNHRPIIRGVKFHVFDRLDTTDDDYNHMLSTTNDDNSNDPTNFRIWSFASVYDSSIISLKEVQAFVEKMVELTIIMRESTEWQTCDVLGVHNEFAPILQQRMEEVVPRDPKVVAIEEKLQLSHDIMSHNIDMILDRGTRLEDLKEDATRLQEMAVMFQKRARDVRRYKMMQNAKHGVMLGTAVTVGVGIVVVPPLVAIL